MKYLDKDKYGHIKLLDTGKYQLGISLGCNAEGKRIRKYRNVIANDYEHAKELLMLFYLEYRNIKIRYNFTQRKRVLLKKHLLEYCKISCNKETCKNKSCKAYKFYLFQNSKVIEEYEK